MPPHEPDVAVCVQGTVISWRATLSSRQTAEIGEGDYGSCSLESPNCVPLLLVLHYRRRICVLRSQPGDRTILMTLGKRVRQDDCSSITKFKRNRNSRLHLATFSDEIILHILSLLPVKDICTVQLLNRHFAQLTTDSILWRTLYRSDFSNRSSATRKHHVDNTQRSATRMKRLGVVNSRDLSPAQFIDWKRRYRIRLNWSRGRCRTYDESERKPFAQVIGDRRVLVEPSVLHIDGQRHELAGVEDIEQLNEAGPDRLLVIATATILVYDIATRTVLRAISSRNHKEVFFLNDFLVIWTSTKSLLIYDLLESIHLIKSFSGLSSTTPLVALRSMGDTTVVSLVLISNGLLSSMLQIQELLCSNIERSLSSSRLIRSIDFPTKPYYRNSTMEDSAIAYEHPYILISHTNSLMLFTIMSTPETVLLSEPRILHGYGATIRSCRINKSLRFVVGSGDAGLRLWDMNDDSIGVSATNREDATIKDFLTNPFTKPARFHLHNSPSGLISAVSDDEVITSNDHGQVMIHNFDI